ncbi:zinc-ribbon domain-containing protein [Dorea ammoniilytica]
MNNSLAEVHPELVSEWSEKNLPLTPDDITFGSNKKVWWRGACGHEWQTSVKARSNGEKCPVYSGARAVAGINDLSTLKPGLASEWSKKNEIKPTEVTVGSHKKVIWKCRLGHEWTASVKSRSINGSGCPYCSHNKVLVGFNDLATVVPKVADEWSEKNYPLQPDEVNAKSRKNVWWHCKKCGNEWKSVIHARIKGTVCPVCAEREVLAGYNDLATTDKNLLSDWDYEQNRIQPTEISRTSAKRAWWKCRHGHSWSMKINERTILGKGCRICEQEYLSVFPAFDLSYYSHMKGLKIELGSDRVLGIPLDTYIPSEQVAIEVNSGSEDMEILKEHLCQQRGIKRIKLPMKSNETESAYAQRIKAAFQSVHIFITSDTEEDVGTIRNVYENWRNSQ